MTTDPDKKNVTTQACPECGYVVDSATAIDGSGTQPIVGDFTICLKCRRPFKFGYDFKLERLTADELVEFKKALKDAEKYDRN